MDRNSRENGPTDININLGPWIEELASLGKHMCSKGTCYLDKLEHRTAQRGFSSLLVGAAQETWLPNFETLWTQSFSLLRATVSGLNYVLEIETWIWCPSSSLVQETCLPVHVMPTYTYKERMTCSFKTVHQKILKLTEGPYQLASFQRQYLCVHMATNAAKKIRAVKKFTLLENTSFMANEINQHLCL